MKRCLASLAALVLVVAVTSCAGKSSSATAVRIAGQTIDVALLQHWTSVIAHGAVLRGPSSGAVQTPRQRALSFLIWSAWVVGEVATRGAPIADAAVERALRTQEAGFPSAPEFESFLKTNGETSADVRLELKTELAASALHRIATSDKPMLAPAEVLDYYRHHKRRFTIDEERVFDIVHYLSFAAAVKLRQDAQRKQAFPGRPLHESLTRNRFLHATPDRRALQAAIFAAKANAAGGPVKFLGRYSVFLIKQITPSRLQSLAAVRSTIEAELIATKHRQAFSAFTSAMVRRWKERTDCGAGFVVEMCSRSPGTPDLEAVLGNAGAAA